MITGDALVGGDVAFGSISEIVRRLHALVRLHLHDADDFKGCFSVIKFDTKEYLQCKEQRVFCLVEHVRQPQMQSTLYCIIHTLSIH